MSDQATGEAAPAPTGRARSQPVAPRAPVDAGAGGARGAWRGAVVIAAVTAAIPLLVASVAGSLDIPWNDDWAYGRATFSLASEGRVRLVPWGAMSLVGHLFWGAPFVAVGGQTYAALRVSQAIAAGLAVLFAFAAARRFTTPRRSLLVAAAVAGFPAFLQTSASFMTDVTSFASQLGALVLGLRALANSGTRRWVLLAASLSVGVYSFTIRETGIAVVGAVVLAAAASDAQQGRLRRMAGVAAAGTVAVVVCAALYTWREGLPKNEVGSDFRVAKLFSPYIARAYFAVAFACIPALVAVRWRWLGASPRRLWTAAAAVLVAVGSVAVGVGVLDGGPVFPGNAFAREGALGNDVLLGARVPAIGTFLWRAVEIAAVAAGGAAAFALVLAAGRALGGSVRAVRAETVALAGFAAANIAGAASGVFFAGGDVYDRYLWPVSFAVTLALMAQGGPTTKARPEPPGTDRRPWVRHTLAGAAVVALVALNTVLLAEQSAFAAARWKAGSWARHVAAVEPTDVDAGFEWTGAHHDYGAAPVARAQPEAWYAPLFPSSRNCVVVSSSPLAGDGLVTIGTRTYRRYAVWGRDQLWIYRTGLCAEPTSR